MDATAGAPAACRPYLLRAKELGDKNPIAYWCKFYAAQQAFGLIDVSNDAKGREWLEGLLGDLEKSKATLADNELITSDLAGSAHVHNFASRVFEGADAADRNGKATRTTAKEFLAVANFFELLAVFGELETDVSEKIKYAKWKAMDISKAFREGRVPSPGPAGSSATNPVALDGPEDASAARNASGGIDEDEQVARQLLGDHRTPDPFQRSPGPPPSDGAFTNITTDNEEDDETAMQQDYDIENPSAFELPPPPSSHSNGFFADSNDDAETTGAFLPSAPKASTSASHQQPPPTLPSAPLFFSDLADDEQQNDPSPPPEQSPIKYIPPPPPAVSAKPRVQATASTSISSPLSKSTTTTATKAKDSSTEWKPAPTDIDDKAISTAQKHAKWAISALNYEDLETARKELKKALDLIGG